MTTYAVFDKDGLIVNRATVEDGSEWTPPEGHGAVAEPPVMDVGGTYINGVYTPPVREVPPQEKFPPSPMELVVFDHENRIRSQEGAPPLTLVDFVDKMGKMQVPK